MIYFRTSLIYMFIISFIIQYYIMSYIMTNNLNNINNSLSKFYVSTAMASMMGLTDMFTMGDQNTLVLFILCVMLVGSVIMYRRQMYIYEKDYLQEMIEHHSMALLTSKSIIEKTNDNQVKNLAQNIIKSQQSEINYMEQLLQKY